MKIKRLIAFFKMLMAIAQKQTVVEAGAPLSVQTKMQMVCVEQMCAVPKMKPLIAMNVIVKENAWVVAVAEVGVLLSVQKKVKMVYVEGASAVQKIKQPIVQLEIARVIVAMVVAADKTLPV